METFIPIIVWGTLGVLLIYLAIRSIRIAKKETFEKRDN